MLGPFKPITDKEFLAKNSIMSMAAIQTKLYPNGQYQIRISDCNNTIKLWGELLIDFDSKEINKISVEEMYEKIDTLQNHLTLFKQKIKEQINNI